MKPKVLIVEDDPVIRKLWRETILSDCRVVFATATSEAYAEMRDDEPPEILVLDWLLNGDARAILNAWLESHSGPCCVISGAINLQDVTEFYQRGVVHVLQKPIRTEVFKAVLQHYLNIVEMKKTCSLVQVEFTKMKKRQTILLVLLFVAVGGKEIVEFVLKFL